jgi:iron(III) transport system permease protein
MASKTTVALRSALRREGSALPLVALLAVLVVGPMVLVFLAAFTTEVPRPGSPGVGSFT